MSGRIIGPAEESILADQAKRLGDLLAALPWLDPDQPLLTECIPGSFLPHDPGCPSCDGSGRVRNPFYQWAWICVFMGKHWTTAQSAHCSLLHRDLERCGWRPIGQRIDQ